MRTYNAIVVLGPTASGKTRLGVTLARAFGGEILSADSRQVYRGLVLGSGKDLAEYSDGGPAVAHHLIDIIDLGHEYNVFEFQRDCYAAFEDVTARDALPVIVGGTGLYLDAVLRGYRMVEAPEDPALRATLATSSDAELAERLRLARGALHNTTDLTDRARLIRAVEIAEFTQSHPPQPAPPLNALLLGTRWPREILRRRIVERLRARFDAGMLDEVRDLRAQGVPRETFDFLGLEYRYIASYLDGEIQTFNDLFQRLAVAIAQFAKRQETWFRRMERQGQQIHWIDQANAEQALEIALRAGFHAA